MGLFKPAYYTEDIRKEDKAVDALKRVDSDEKLLEIYQNAPLLSVSSEALNRVKSPELLRGLLRNNQWRRWQDIRHIIWELDDVSILIEMVNANDRLKQDEILQILSSLGLERAVKIIEQLEYPKHKLLLRGIMGCKTWDALNRAAARRILDSEEKLPEPDMKEIVMVLPYIDTRKAVEVVEQLEYPKDKILLRNVMRNSRLAAPITEAAAKKIPVSEEADLVKEVLKSGPNGAASAFCDSLKMPEDKDVLLEMLKRDQPVRTRAAEILAQDETMKEYRFCPYCGRPASSITNGYLGCYGDMFYYGYRCKCGHTSSAPEGYGEPDDLAVTLAEYIEDPDRYKA